MYTKDFSIIVPCWRGAIKFLPKLFDSIPPREGIEIIVVDNSKEPVSRDEIESDREIVLLHSAPERHAGGSRNDGIEAANGKWLLFADADDYYTPDAFDIYYSMFDSDAEIIYTGMRGVYEDTGEPSDRGDKYVQMVHGYCTGDMDESVLRTSFGSPCCKMVSHDLVDRKQIRYDEIRASNDVYFSLVSGFYAKKIGAVDKITYVATVNHGSLTQRRDFDVLYARLFARLKCNKFLKENSQSNHQKSVMVYLFEARHFTIRRQIALWKMVLKFKQNPFVGWRHWRNTLKCKKNIDKRDSKYRVD